MSECLPPVIILDRPQLAENIGSVARVMANFGFTELRMVAPRDGWPQDRAWAASSGAHWVLEDAKVFATVAEAISDLQRVYATTARNRETQLPVLTPRETASDSFDATATGLRCGFLFGAERAGLETLDVALCQSIVTIPVDPKFHSLNLSQAVGVLAYEWRTLVLNAPPKAFTDYLSPPASLDNLHRLYEHLETELEKGGFFYPVEKRDNMVRNIRVMLNKASLTEQEIRTFRGMITALTKGRGRVLEKLAQRGK